MVSRRSQKALRPPKSASTSKRLMIQQKASTDKYNDSSHNHPRFTKKSNKYPIESFRFKAIDSVMVTQYGYKDWVL